MKDSIVKTALIAGFAMAAVLAGTSLRTYQVVSARLEVDHVRRQMAAFASKVEALAHRNPERLTYILQTQMQLSGGTIMGAEILNEAPSGSKTYRRVQTTAGRL